MGRELEPGNVSGAEAVLRSLSGGLSVVLPAAFARKHLACCAGENIFVRRVLHWNNTRVVRDEPKFVADGRHVRFFLGEQELYHLYSDLMSLSLGRWRDRRDAISAHRALTQQVPDLTHRLLAVPSPQSSS